VKQARANFVLIVLIDRKFYLFYFIFLPEADRNFSAVFAGNAVFPEMFEVILFNEDYEIFCRKFNVPRT
jgi:hypothetical protein